MNNFLLDEWDKRRAKKRGGGETVLSLDAAEEKYLQIPATSVSPEQAFDRRWVMILLEHGMRRLQAEFKAARKVKQFELLKEFLSNGSAPGEYRAVARKLSMSSNRVAVIVCRMRQRLGELVRKELAQTVLTRADLEDEFRHLFD
jgi:RNA polymerase sigma-70 factor (ECF subfamily)